MTSGTKHNLEWVDDAFGSTLDHWKISSRLRLEYDIFFHHSSTYIQFRVWVIMVCRSPSL